MISMDFYGGLLAGFSMCWSASGLGLGLACCWAGLGQWDTFTDFSGSVLLLWVACVVSVLFCYAF